jgi:threonine aldolase
MINLRSDIFTTLEPAKIQSMSQAEGGNDCCGEDPSVCALEECHTKILFKLPGVQNRGIN